MSLLRFNTKVHRVRGILGSSFFRKYKLPVFAIAAKFKSTRYVKGEKYQLELKIFAVFKVQQSLYENLFFEGRNLALYQRNLTTVSTTISIKKYTRPWKPLIHMTFHTKTYTESSKNSWCNTLNSMSFYFLRKSLVTVSKNSLTLATKVVAFIVW